jgi:hypothetical protein
VCLVDLTHYMQAHCQAVRVGAPRTPSSGNTVKRARAGKRTTLPNQSSATQAKLKRKTRPHTGLGSKVYRPTEPRAVLDRIHAIIREGRETANEPLPTPSSIIAKPHLLRKDLRALRGASIALHACADGACRLRERSESGIERGEEEGEVGG